MKTFKIRYEFFNRQLSIPEWDIANAVVVAENIDEAFDMFWSNSFVDCSFQVEAIEEINTKCLIWAF